MGNAPLVGLACGAAVVAARVGVGGAAVSVAVAGGAVGVIAAMSVRRALAVLAAAVITALGSEVGSVGVAGAGDLQAVRMTANDSTTTNMVFLDKLAPPVRFRDKYTLNQAWIELWRMFRAVGMSGAMTPESRPDS